jgi:ferritin-like metal-binding protein YciE
VVRTFASLLGEDDAMATLQRTLNEEAETDKKLTRLAESIINVEATEAENGEKPKRRTKKSGGRG